MQASWAWMATNWSGVVIGDRFEIRDRLGDGGMGTVYRAWQRSVQREVAIKVIAPSGYPRAEAMHRFEREAQIASQLSHPAFVTVLDHGESPNGQRFIVMELVRGRDLSRVLKQEGPLSVERVIRIGVQICDALQTAHAFGVIHRDLKLENVMILDHPPGRDLVKVLDFGLAKHLDDDRGLTARGLVVGTPHYISPEASVTGVSRPACDVYALGVILAELAIGQWLWTGGDLMKLLERKRRPAEIIKKLPLALRSALGAMIDPRPEHRPSAARAREQLLSAAKPDPVDDVLAALNRDDAECTTVMRRPAGNLSQRAALAASSLPPAPSGPAEAAPAVPAATVATSFSLPVMDGDDEDEAPDELAIGTGSRPATRSSSWTWTLVWLLTAAMLSALMAIWDYRFN